MNKVSTIIPDDIYALSLIPGIGNESLKKLVNSGSTLTNLISYPEDKLRLLVKGIRASSILALKNEMPAFQDEARARLSNYERRGIQLISYWDKNYPPFFKLIDDAPVFLYAKGNLKLLEKKKCVAIVGTRECTDRGFSVALNLSRAFKKKGYCIVSGLALGIDTAAHQGALAENCPTIAVLVDVENIYPTENEELASSILEYKGLLIAENPPGTKVFGGLFVKRDRLQSAFSLAVVPCETSINGGTMHTVRYSQKQNRLLFVPDYSEYKDYDTTNKGYAGIRQIIKDGRAKIISKKAASEIIDNLLPLKMKELEKGLETLELRSDLFG